MGILAGLVHQRFNKITQILSVSFFKTYALWLLLFPLGIFFGGLAYTANPVAIGMGVSLIIGILLLKKPEWNVEIVIILGLVVAGLVPLFFDALASKALWGIAILAFLLLFSALYRLITTHKLIKITPAFIWIALVFFIYTIIVSVFQFSSEITIGAFKRYYQVWGLLFGLVWMDFSKQSITRWCMIALIIFLLQSPLCLHQLFFLVPLREGYLEIEPNLVPIDVVSGTFGAIMYGGGNSADMATSLLMIFMVILARLKEGVITGKKSLMISSLLLLPLFIGETKIIIIFFPLMLVVLYRQKLLTKPHYLIAALILGSMFIAIFLNVLVMVTKMSLDALIEDTLRTNLYGGGYGGYYLNRTTVLTFWGEHNDLSDPLSFLFGNGLGSTLESPDPTKMGGFIDMRYPNYGVGFTGAAMLLWETGVFGTSLFLGMMVLAWRCASRLMTESLDPIVRADAAAIQPNIVIFSLYPFYVNSLFSQIPFQVVLTFMLGYLAWLHKQHIGYKNNE